MPVQGREKSRENGGNQIVQIPKALCQGAAVPHTKATAGQPTNKMPVPEHVVIPMSMHIGAPAEPVVKKGDTVMVGTVIGKAGGFVSANIYSSVSGTVQDIAPLRMVNGAMTTLSPSRPTVRRPLIRPVCRPSSPTKPACWLPCRPAAWWVSAAPASRRMSSWRPTPSTRCSSTLPSASPT